MKGIKLLSISCSRLNLLLFSLFFSMLLSGCGDDGFSDLHKYIVDVKAKPKGTIEPLPEVKPVEPFVFKPEGLRDPFKSISESLKILR